MSLGWKKFSFFEREDIENVLPDTFLCSCSSATHFFCGLPTGEVCAPIPSPQGFQVSQTLVLTAKLEQVVVLGRSLNDQRVFHAHLKGVLQLACAQVGLSRTKTLYFLES